MKKIVVRKGLVMENIGESITIFDGENSVLHTLNNTGAFIFKQLIRGKNKGRIIEAITKKYQIRKAVAEKDFDEFAGGLRKKGIIEITDS